MIVHESNVLDLGAKFAPSAEAGASAMAKTTNIRLDHPCPKSFLVAREGRDAQKERNLAVTDGRNYNLTTRWLSMKVDEAFNELWAFQTGEKDEKVLLHSPSIIFSISTFASLVSGIISSEQSARFGEYT